MSNNVTLNPGAAGSTIATRDNGSNVQFQEVLIVTGASGSENVVDSTHPLFVQPVGGAASGAAASGNPVPVAGTFLTTQPTVTNGQAVTQAMTARGAQIIASGVDTVYVATGGSTTAAVAAAAAASAIKASAGRLCKVLVTTAGTAALNFYDNASTNTGTIIGTVTAAAVAGTVFTFDMPAANGIWCASGTNTPAVTVSYL